MATATMATAAGAAALLYYTLNRKLQSSSSRQQNYESSSDISNPLPIGIERVSHRLIQAPATWLETISTLSETLRFTYSETLGKWPIGDLAFGISFLLKRQGNLHVGGVFGGKDCIQLKGADIVAELRYLLNLLTLCWHFSKKPFSVFLLETGYVNENVLLQEPKAGLLKPAFTILLDDESKHFLLLIRGTHSMKDTLTAATGAVVPFHHTVVCEGGVSNLVLGYAHCGMVAAARWIAKLSIPCLVNALQQHPDYRIKVVGHSLGGGTAALLTYILREQKEFSSATCVTFAPAACMTWELAESGNSFITSIINEADLVPTFSAASVDDLRAEVTASAWLNDLRHQIEQTRILSTVYRSASALGSRLPSIAAAKAKVAGAGAILRPVSNGTQVVMRRAQSMAQAAWTRPALRFSSWSCMGPRRRVVTGDSPGDGPSSSSEPLFEENPDDATSLKAMELPVSTDVGAEWSSEMESSSRRAIHEIDGDLSRRQEHMTEVELWQQLEHELYDGGEGSSEDIKKELEEEEEEAMAEVGDGRSTSPTASMKEAHRFFPPGNIMHIVTLPSEDWATEEEAQPILCGVENSQADEGNIGIFMTPRSLYSKLRLSHTMISDHFMPVYRLQIEKVIKTLENES